MQKDKRGEELVIHRDERVVWLDARRKEQREIEEKEKEEEENTWYPQHVISLGI